MSTQRLDFRWAHDFNLRIGKTMHKLQLTADFMNIGNLFNSKWGVEKNMSECNNGAILYIDKIENGTPYFSMFRSQNAEGEMVAPTKTWSFDRNYSQCWQLQIGVKYYFN